MVSQITKKRYLIFIEALLVACFIFSFGILAGIFIENARLNKVQQNFGQLEIEMLDVRLISSLISSSNCELAIQENINFADRVFWEARELDKYEKASELTDDLKLQHKKYDLLRASIWLNSIEIKKRCNADYHNVVYIYDYEDTGLDMKAKQEVISNILLDLKDKYQNNILLISMAGDINSPSIELLKQQYNITELPTIIIDEKYQITELTSIEDIEKYLI